MFRKISETSDEKYERIIVSENELGDRVTCYFPRHTPEEQEKIDANIRRALRDAVNKCIEKYGYEWTREHFEAEPKAEEGTA